MPALQQLNELFTEIEASVTDLTKRQSTLIEDCKGLEAKRQFTVDAIEKLKHEHNDLLASGNSVVEKQNETIQSNRITIADTESELTTLRSKREKVLNDITVARESEAAETARIDAKTAKLHTALTELEDQLEKKRTALAKITAEITASKQAAEVLNGQVEKKAGEVSVAIKELEAEEATAREQTVVATKALEEVQVKVGAANVELDSVLEETKLAREQHQIFQNYETTARAKLQAASDSLGVREAALTEATKRAQRSGIL